MPAKTSHLQKTKETAMHVCVGAVSRGERRSSILNPPTPRKAKGIWLHGIYEGKQPGPPGGGQFGLLGVSLVK